MPNNNRSPHPDNLTMKAVGFSDYVKDGKLELFKDLPKPTIEEEGEILIKVHAASLNPIDKIRWEGGLKILRPEKTWPAIIGYDAAGVIEQVHEKISCGLKVGDEVYVRTTKQCQGTLAEYCVAHESLVTLKPKNFSFEEAASIPLAGVTAYQAFLRGGVKEGDRVIISGGAGGVGTIAIQIAKHVLKCSVVATTASAGEKTELCKSLGADIVVNYRENDFEVELGKEEKFDFAFDTTNESHKMPSLLKPGSKCVTIAGTPSLDEISKNGSPGLIVKFFLWWTRNKAAMNAAKKNEVEWSYLFLNPNAADLAKLTDAAESDQLKATIDNVCSLEEFQKSVDKLVSGRSKGKNILKLV